MPQTMTCYHCSTPLELVGEEDFRTGGTTGFAAMFLGNINQLSEGILALQMYRCPSCGHVDFFLPGR